MGIPADFLIILPLLKGAQRGKGGRGSTQKRREGGYISKVNIIHSLVRYSHFKFGTQNKLALFDLIIEHSSVAVSCVHFRELNIL